MKNRELINSIWKSILIIFGIWHLFFWVMYFSYCIPNQNIDIAIKIISPFAVVIAHGILLLLFRKLLKSWIKT